MSPDLVLAFKKRFIVRADAKAIQTLTGEYRPVRNTDGVLVPWSDLDLTEHLNCQQTYGHYLLGPGDKCKLFAFDIDLSEQSVKLPSRPAPDVSDPRINDSDFDEWDDSFIDAIPRLVWRDRSHPARPWIKTKMRSVAEEIARRIFEEFDIPIAAAYSGYKGIHVYAFTGKTDAAECVNGAQIVIDLLGGWHKHPLFKTLWQWDKYPIFNFEVYPKQATIGTDGFGNLLRLPLGRNLKAPKDPTFFLDFCAPFADLKPTDSLWALTDGAINPWKEAWR